MQPSKWTKGEHTGIRLMWASRYGTCTIYHEFTSIYRVTMLFLKNMFHPYSYFQYKVSSQICFAWSYPAVSQQPSWIQSWPLHSHLLSISNCGPGNMSQGCITSNDWDQLIILIMCEGQGLPVGKEATANHEEKEPEEVLPFIRRSPNPENNLVCFEKFLTQLVFNLVNQRR